MKLNNKTTMENYYCLFNHVAILICCRFVRRGFSECSIDSIPQERRKKINLSRRSKYYIKSLQPERGGITASHIAFRNL